MAREELESIVRKGIYPITSSLPEKERIVVDNHIAKQTAQAILDAGYTKNET